jgi:SSS family solute:Na+ symporter
MSPLDWLIVSVYVLIPLGISIYFSKRGASGVSEFFVAGRSLGWFVAGTGMVATTFSSDTPLMVAGLSRRTGIYDNWFWWSAAIGYVAAVFFFAKLWRRCEVITDIEFVVKRYDAGASTNFLRVFNVFYNAFVNILITASVFLAMSKILTGLLHLDPAPICTVPLLGGLNTGTLITFGLAVLAIGHTILAGQYGIAYIAVFQFSLAMVGCIGLAVFVYLDAVSGQGLAAKLHSSPVFKPEQLNFFPDFLNMGTGVFTFFAYVIIAIINGASSGGYFVQKLSACKSEKDAFLGFLWFNFCHFIVRPWPWIVVGIMSMYYLPNLSDPEMSFPQMIDLFMPIGLKGLMLAALFAAFTDTVDTQMNWGASFVINDFYMPFVNKNKSQRHYVFVSRICMLIIVISATLIAVKLTSILDIYKYLAVIGGAVGTVLIARWYWWRVNAFSELSAIAASLIIGNALEIYLPSTDAHDLFAVRALINITAVLIIWVIVTILTSRAPSQKTFEFYKMMKIGGPGWAKICRITGIEPPANELRNNVIGWASCVITIYAVLFCLGKLLFQQWLSALTCFIVAALAGFVLSRSISSIHFIQPEAHEQPTKSEIELQKSE